MARDNAPELSDVKAGSGGFRRSRGANFRASEAASVLLQDFSQDISGAGAEAEAFAQGLNDFFPGLAALRQARHAREIDDIRQENEDLAVLAQNLGTQNPEKMQRALETGDFSEFGDAIPDGATSRRAFVETGEETVGALQGNDMAQDPAFLEGMATAPDLEEYRAGYLKEQLKGARPILAQAATERFTQRTEQAMVQERQRRTLEQSEIGLVRARKALFEEITSGDLASPADLARHEAVFRVQGAILGPTQAAAAVDQMYDELFRVALQGDQRAIRLINARDPQQYNGTSVVDRRKYDWDAAEHRAMANVGHVQELAHQRELFEISLQPPEQQIQSLDILDRKWEPTVESMRLRDQAVAAMGSQLDLSMLWDMGAEGRDDLDQDLVRKALKEGGYAGWYQAMEARRVDPEKATRRLATTLSRYGAPSNVKWEINRDLLADDPTRQQRAVLLLRSINEVNGNTNDVLPSSGHAVWVAVEQGLEYGIDPATVLTAVREKGFTGETDENVFQKRYRQTTEETFKNNGEALNNAMRIAEEKHGLDVGDGFVPFDRPDIDDDDEVQAQLRSTMDATARFYAGMFPDKSLAEVYDLAARAVAPRLQVEYINGSHRVTLGSSDTFSGAEGQEGLRFRSGADTINATLDHLSTKRVDLGLTPPPRPGDQQHPRAPRRTEPAPFGSEDLLQGEVRVTGLRVDEETSVTNSYAVSVEGGAGPAADLAFEPGALLEVPATQSDSALFKHWERSPELEAREGHVIIRAPDADTIDEEGTFWHVAGGRVSWRARPKEPTGTAITDEEQAERLNLPMTRPAVHPRLGMLKGRKTKEYLDKRADEASDLDAQSRSKLKTLMKEILDPAAAEDEVSEARKETLKRGRFLLDFSTPEGAEFWNAFLPILEEHEGFRKVAYDDHTGLDILEGTKAKGDPTIGFGFNLARPDARKLLEDMGLDYAAVSSGRVQITRAQASALSQSAAKELGRVLWSTFKDLEEPLKPHQWQALMSLAYNSRVKDGMPTLIGPNLTAAIKRGDMEAAADEIRLRSAGGVPPSLKPGILLRRAKEAAMFLGRPIPQEWIVS